MNCGAGSSCYRGRRGRSPYVRGGSSPTPVSNTLTRLLRAFLTVLISRASSSNTYILPPPRRCFSYLALEANKKFLFDLEIEKKAVTATFFEDHDCWSQRREDTHGLKSKIELHLARITPRQQQQISGQDRITMSRINLSTGERIRIRLANTSISTPTMRL